MKLIKILQKTHPGEVIYVVVYWLHGFDPILVCLFVLCTAIMLSVNRDTLTLYRTVSKSKKYTLHLINKQHAFKHTFFYFTDNIKLEKNK